MNCSLRKAESADEVSQILRDPEIFERIAEDGQTLEDMEIPFDESQCYMLIEVEDMIIGVWCLYPANSSTLNIHCNILKDYRQHAEEAAKLIVKWFAEESPSQYIKLNAEIPVIYPDVYFFTKKFGFLDEGINRQSICKNGGIIDQWRLGLTRGEAVDFLEAK